MYMYIYICDIHGYAMYRHRTREPIYIYPHTHILYADILNKAPNAPCMN
jgi:hypothetical protein